MTFSDIRIVAELLAAYARHRVGRTLITLLSTVSAAAVVVWVVSGYDSLLAKFDDYADKYLGRYGVIVIPKQEDDDTTPFKPPVPLAQEIVEQLRRDADVLAVDAVFQTRASVRNPNVEIEEEKTPPPVPGDQNTTPMPLTGPALSASLQSRGNRNPTLVGTDAAEPPYAMTQGRWLARTDALEAVISLGSAERLKVKIGDQLLIAAGGRRDAEQAVEIVGIVEQRQPLPQAGVIIGLPAMRGPSLTRGPAGAAIYVSRELAGKITGRAVDTSFAGVVLKPGVDAKAFRSRWAERVNSQAEVQSLSDVEAELENSTTSEHVRGQAWSATGISLLASLFIIFTTLSMGVDERIRQLAILRAVALTRAQIALLILFEALLLGAVGWLGGLVAGWGLLSWLAQSRPELFPTGTSLGVWCIVLSGLCALGGSLVAAVLPAWKATRVRPLDIVGGGSSAPMTRIPWGITFLGLVLIGVNPLLVFYVPMPDTSRYLMSAALGCTAMAIGFVLLTPLAILVTERFIGPLVARSLRLEPYLLALQLSSNLWRTLGTAIALTLGLGLFVSMQVWGYSMLAPFMPGDWTPDLVAAIQPSGVPDEHFDELRAIQGVRASQFTPLASQQVKFRDDVTGAKVRATSSRQDNCVMLGADVEQLLGDAAMFKFRFIKGSRLEALAKFRSGGRYCLVPDHFERESQLTVGDQFAVRLPNKPDETVEYEIAGVVNMNGWHWMSKVGLRNQGGGRSAGLMFAPFDRVRADFDLKRIQFFWMNLDGTTDENAVKTGLQAVADKYYDPSVRGRRGGSLSGGFGPPGNFGKQRQGATVAIRTAAGVRKEMRQRADSIIWLLSQLPLVTLAVTSLGVVNTVLASVRARRWELGILRALGVTGFQLIRLVVGEAILIGLVACLLSLCFGALAGYCGVGVTRYVNVRGGQITHLVIPWLQVSMGFAITLFLCFLAAVWPAIQTGRTEPLTLLQQGRTAI